MNKPENFYELFRQVEDEINGIQLEEHAFDVHRYRKEAERLANKKSDRMANALIIVFMLSVIIISLQYIAIEAKKSQIQYDRNMTKMLLEPTTDSIKFDCLRCGHPHDLSADSLKLSRFK